MAVKKGVARTTCLVGRQARLNGRHAARVMV